MIPPSHFSGKNGKIKEFIQENNSIAEPKEEYTKTKVESSPTKKAIVDTPEEITKPTTVEKPQIKTERNTTKVSAFSLKSIQKKQQFKEELASKKVVHKEMPAELFSEKEMVDAWNLYAKKVEKEGKYNLSSHLTMGIPKLKENTIQLEFPNNTIKVEVERAKHELLAFLKESLNNFEIDLDIVVNETAQKKYAYTAIEKYEKLKEKNPMIDRLRKEFGLEIN